VEHEQNPSPVEQRLAVASGVARGGLSLDLSQQATKSIQLDVARQARANP